MPASSNSALSCLLEWNSTSLPTQKDCYGDEVLTYFYANTFYNQHYASYEHSAVPRCSLQNSLPITLFVHFRYHWQDPQNYNIFCHSKFWRTVYKCTENLAYKMHHINYYNYDTLTLQVTSLIQTKIFRTTAYYKMCAEQTISKVTKPAWTTHFSSINYYTLIMLRCKKC